MLQCHMAGKPQIHKNYISPRTVPVNDTYFDQIDTPNKAYVLGMLAADGYLTTKRPGVIGLDLNPRDIHILHDIAEEIGYEGEVKVYQLARLMFTSHRAWTRLTEYGFTTNKSFDLPGMDGVVPPELASHLVRGYFDGNGSWTYALEGCKGTPSYRRWLSWNVRSTPAMCHYIQGVLPAQTSYHFSKTGILKAKVPDRVQAIGEWMYRDADLKLNRKYHRWLELCPTLSNGR